MPVKETKSIFKETRTITTRLSTIEEQGGRVIGAGFAGLAAAYKLKNAGWNVTILEARDRIGGRVFSHKDERTGLICELGAEWVGESHDRIKALCRDFKIPLQKRRFEDHLLRDGREFRPALRDIYVADGEKRSHWKLRSCSLRYVFYQ